MQTPLETYPELAKKLGISEVYFKREDLHPYGSHKGRSIPYMIDHYKNQGKTRFAVSSSGNAARAAMEYIKESPELYLTVFIGQHIDPIKEKMLHEYAVADNITLTKVDRPQQALFELVKSAGVISLRQSTDDTALLGYKTLSEELQDADAVFVPTSSGTLALALALQTNAHVHAVQTTVCNPFTSPFDTEFEKEDESLAGAIVDRVGQRKNDLIPRLSGGWVISNEEIMDAIRIVKETTDLDISPNSALSVAGLMKTIKNGFAAPKKVVCMITGA